MRTEPKWTCKACGRVQIVKPDGRGNPPDIAKRNLIKQCLANGHVSEPEYRAGFGLTRPGGMSA